MCPGLLVTLALLNPAAPVPKDPSPLRRLNEEKRTTARELLRLSRVALDKTGMGRTERAEADLADAARAVRDANVALGADPVAAREAYRKECRATEQALAALVQKGLVRPSLLWRATIRTLDAEIDLTADAGEVKFFQRAKRGLAEKGAELAQMVRGCHHPGGALGELLELHAFPAVLRDAGLAVATRDGERAEIREASRKWWERIDVIARSHKDMGIALPLTALQVTARRLDAEIEAATRPEDRRGLREMRLTVAREAARLAELAWKHNHHWWVPTLFPVYEPAVTLRDAELVLLTAAPDRIAACERCVAAVRRVEADRMAAFATGTASAEDYLRVRLARLDAEIRLVEEGGRLPPGR